MEKKKSFSKKWLLLTAGVLGLAAVDASASTTTLGGSQGSYTLSGSTDTYGMGSTFVKLANLMSDNGLNKIIGIAGGVTALVLAYNARYSSGIVTAAIATVGAFLPQAVDAFYGALI